MIRYEVAAGPNREMIQMSFQSYWFERGVIWVPFTIVRSQSKRSRIIKARVFLMAHGEREGLLKLQAYIKSADLRIYNEQATIEYDVCDQSGIIVIS